MSSYNNHTNKLHTTLQQQDFRTLKNVKKGLQFYQVCQIVKIVCKTKDSCAYTKGSPKLIWMSAIFYQPASNLLLSTPK